ncbi:hypothetical protein TNCV_1599691 [Trichonephila clavipes]|nr:hypothetical protein TNCV_1599691 [Trichonephila clavipes]
MVEVKSINISLNQLSPGLSVRTTISPTLTEEIIIHPSVYAEIKKLSHAKSDVLLSESESSLSADLGAYAYPSAVSFSNVIENSSYDLPHVKNFNTRNDSSSLIKDYKCNKVKSTKLKLSIVREKYSDIVLCKKVNGAMKTSSVEFISRSPNPSPMERNYRRFVLLRRILSPGSGNEGKREIVLNRRPERYRGKYRCVQPKINFLKKTFLCLFSSGIHGKEKRNTYHCGQRTVRLAVVACSQKPSSLRAQAQLMRTETVETFELVKVEPKLLKKENASRRYLLHIIVKLIG